MSANKDLAEKREWAFVVVSAVLILALTPSVVSIMIEAWEVEGFVWQTAVDLTSNRGYNIDLVVSVPSGLALGWIFLFALDESKKIQSVIIPIFGAVFAVFIWSEGLWFGETVDWSKNILPFLVAFLVGITTGGGTNYITQRRRRFERSGWLLYISVAATSIVAIIQLGIVGELSPSEAIIDSVATASLLFVLSVFIEYENIRDISVIATREEPRATVVGGLCKTIRDENLNHSFQGEGAEKMIRALSSLNDKDSILPDLSGEIEFRYKDRSSLISKWVSVKAESVDVRYIKRQMNLEGKPKTEKDNIVSKALGLGIKPIRVLIPPRFRSYITKGRSGDLASRLDTSDMIVVTVSFPELVSEEVDDRQSVEAIEKILERYSENGPEVLLTVTEAEIALEQYREKRGETPLLNEGKLEDYIRMEAFDDYYKTDIVSVSTEKNMELGDGTLSWQEMNILLDRMSG